MVYAGLAKQAASSSYSGCPATLDFSVLISVNDKLDELIDNIVCLQKQKNQFNNATKVRVSVAANFGSTSTLLQFLFEVPFQICLFSAKGKSTNMCEMPTNVEYVPGP